MRACTRCPSKASKGLKTCFRCTKRLAMYRARYKRKKRIESCTAVSAGPIKDYPELGYDLALWESDMRKLAKSLGHR